MLRNIRGKRENIRMDEDIKERWNDGVFSGSVGENRLREKNRMDRENNSQYKS